MSNKNVVIITPVYPPNISVGGGVAVTYGALTKKLESRGHNVKVLSPRLDNVDYGKSLLYANFPVMFPTMQNLEIFAEEIEACDVVVVPDDCMLPFVSFICRWKNKPLLFNMHTNVKMVLDLAPQWYLRWIAAPCVGMFFQACSKISDKTFTTSPSYHDLLVKTGHRCDGVFSPRIKTAVFEQDDDEEEIRKARLFLCGGNEEMTKRSLLIYAGRLSHEKRIQEVAYAKPADAVVAIVGDGPQAQVLYDELNDPENGVFVHVGMQDQARLRVLYKASDFLVSASKFETLGMTVLESHLCGTPVAVQKAAGFVSQVTENINGFFVNYDNADEARKELEHAIANKPSKETVLESCKTRWDAALPELDQLVLDMAEEGREPDFSWWMWPVMAIYLVIYTVMGFPFNTLTNRITREQDKEEERRERNQELAARKRSTMKKSLSQPASPGSNADAVENHPVVFIFSCVWFWVVIQPILS